MKDIRRGAVNLRALFVLAAVFIAGGAAGVAIDRFALLRSARVVARGEGWREPTPSAETRRALATGIPTHMLRLDLTPEQQAKLTEIARRRRPQAESVLKTLQPLARNMETQMMQEMLCALTPAQQAHWLAYMDTARFDSSIVAERYRPVRTNTCAAVEKP